jgi:hypothetical protein
MLLRTLGRSRAAFAGGAPLIDKLTKMAKAIRRRLP